MVAHMQGLHLFLKLAQSGIFCAAYELGEFQCYAKLSGIVHKKIHSSIGRKLLARKNSNAVSQLLSISALHQNEATNQVPESKAIATGEIAESTYRRKYGRYNNSSKRNTST